MFIIMYLFNKSFFFLNPDWIGGLNQSPCYRVSDLPLKNGQLSNTDNDTWWGIYENAGGGMPQLQLLTREKLKFLKPE